MGTDKGLIFNYLKNLTWVEILFFMLTELNFEVFVSINLSQFDSYSKIIDSKNLIIDQSDYQGPICGLISAHQLYPKEDFLVLACDMQNVNKSLILQLISNYAINQMTTFYKNDDNFIEPFPAIYAKNIFENQLINSNIGPISLLKKEQKANEILIIKEIKHLFSNFNTKTDLER